MKFIKKVTVYLLVGFLCCSSVTISYQKANTCKAVSIGVGITFAVLAVGAICYGAYYVAQPENRDTIKESMSNYADMTVENAKWCYQTNKKLFEDFCEYASANGGGSSAVYTVGGQSFAINAMKEHGFPSFEDWDVEMKKQGSPASSGSFGSIWDRLSFGADLLSLLCDFFEEEEYTGGTGREQSYFHGDSDYINRETGEVYINYASRAINKNWISSDGGYWDYKYVNYDASISGRVEEQYKENFRFALCVVGCGTPIPPILCEEFSDYPVAYNNLWTRQRMGIKSKAVGLVYIKDRTESYSKVADGLIEEVDEDEFYITCNVNSDVYVWGDDLIAATNFKSYVYFSGNVPIFSSYDEADYYIETGDFSNALNLAPELQPTPTSIPIDKKDSAVAIYCNHFNGRSVVPADIVNINYNIVNNNWDGTPENLTVILNDDDKVITSEPQQLTPVPTLPDEDGGNTTNNYIINITNILQPIQTTVTNIYNFFVIDTDIIKQEFDNINTTPVVKFENVVKRVNVLRHTFSDEPHENIVQAGDSTVYGIYYPVIKMKCHSALEPYLNADKLLDVEGVKYIVLLDFKEWAVVLVRVRGFMKIALWVGMIFWVMKQVRVVITIS